MKTNQPIRIGVIGLGQIAVKAHLPGYDKVKGCSIKAIQSNREEHAKRVAAQYGIPHIYKDWKKLLESDHVDAVSICTPNFTHLPIALKALKEGKHILVEKPLGLSLSEVKTIIQAAKKYRRVLMVHHNMRFDPAVRTARKLLSRNVIGKVFAFKSTLSHRGPQAWNPLAQWFFDKKKAGGGALMDLGPHHFDSLRYLLQDEARVVGAVATNGGERNRAGGEVHASCLLQFKKGTVGVVTVGWADTNYQNRFYFIGTKGTLSLNLAKGEPITVEIRDKEGKTHPPLAKDSFNTSIYKHFIDCVKNGEKPQVSAMEGFKVLEMIEQGYRLIKKNRSFPH
jgi:predicted dehydrogenase